MSRPSPLTALKGLHAPLLVLLTTLIVSLVASFEIDDRHTAAQDTLTRAQQQRQAQQAQAQRAAADHLEAEQLSTRLTDIEASGLLSEPKRLDWIDALEHVRRQRGLVRIDYEISPQTPLPPDFLAAPLQHWVAQRTPMRVSFQALHEGDLLAVLETLAALKPWMHIERCSLSRPAPQAPTAQGLAVQCVISWLHLKEKK